MTTATTPRKIQRIPDVVAIYMLEIAALRTIEIPSWEPELDHCWVRRTKSGDLPLGRYAFTTNAPYGPVSLHWLSAQVHLGIPQDTGLVVDHLCHQPACWRPSHLDLVTVKVNNQRRQRRGENRSWKYPGMEEPPIEERSMKGPWTRESELRYDRG